jgi:hypothetical protein
LGKAKIGNVCSGPHLGRLIEDVDQRWYAVPVLHVHHDHGCDDHVRDDGGGDSGLLKDIKPISLGLWQ